MEFTKYCQELVRLLQTSLLNLTESKIRRLRHSLLVIMKLPPICISFVPISLKGLLKIMLLFSACHVEIPHGSGHTGYGSLDQHPANWQVHTVPVLIDGVFLFFFAYMGWLFPAVKNPVFAIIYLLLLNRSDSEILGYALDTLYNIICNDEEEEQGTDFLLPWKKKWIVIEISLIGFNFFNHCLPGD